MNSRFFAAGSRPPGEMPPIDPDSIETDETFAAIISRNDTGKLTVTRREPPRPAPATGPAGDAPPEPAPGDRNTRAAAL